MVIDPDVTLQKITADRAVDVADTLVKYEASESSAALTNVGGGLIKFALFAGT